MLREYNVGGFVGGRKVIAGATWPRIEGCGVDSEPGCADGIELKIVGGDAGEIAA